LVRRENAAAQTKGKDFPMLNALKAEGKKLLGNEVLKYNT